MPKSVTGVFKAALVGLAFLAAACASTANYAFKPWDAKITDPGQMYSTLNWEPTLEQALLDAGRKGEIPTIKSRYREADWPQKFADFDERIEAPDTIKLYKVEVIARFRFDNNSAVLLRAPAMQNAHMPDGWRPVEDIYIVIKESAVAPR